MMILKYRLSVPLSAAVLCLAMSFGPITGADARKDHSVTGPLESQFKQWENSKSVAMSETLLTQIRTAFNRQPRNMQLRRFLMRGLESRLSSKMSWQDKELIYYQLLNLKPRDKHLRQTLQNIMHVKHGKYTPQEIKQAYRHLNDAFNTWDKGQVKAALALFKKAQLKNSPELTAIYAYHLRDAGQLEDAMNVLRSSAKSGYLGWTSDMVSQMKAAQKQQKSKDLNTKLKAWLKLGKISAIETSLKNAPETAMKHWFMAKVRERQGQYHPASQHYFKYYEMKLKNRFPGHVPVVYKAQLEDLNSVDLIALKFRTSPDLIRQANENYTNAWVDTYRMLIVPVVPHDMHWPTKGYVSSHFGFRLHPIRGTWRLHEGVDIETLAGVNAEAAHKGTVVRAGFDKACGNMVRLSMTSDLNTVYCHGDKLIVSKGQKVSAGSALLVTGNTGASASNHLHFGVKFRGQYVDPMDWL